MEGLGASPRRRDIQPQTDKCDPGRRVQESCTPLGGRLGLKKPCGTHDRTDVDERVECDANGTHDNELQHGRTFACQELWQEGQEEQGGLYVERLDQDSLQQCASSATGYDGAFCRKRRLGYEQPNAQINQVRGADVLDHGEGSR